MDSLSSVSPSIILPPGNPLRHHHHHRWRRIGLPFSCRKQERLLSSFSGQPYYMESGRRRCMGVFGKLSSGGEEEREEDGEDGRDEEVERALHMDGTIPVTSDEFVKRVSSRAYNMRRHLEQTFDSSSYDVGIKLNLDSFRQIVLSSLVLEVHGVESEVERELGLLFSKGEKRRNQAKQSVSGTKFPMLVEDVREGVLVSSYIYSVLNV
ncbi:unnamed protein product [Ilex paraguariensis]|uniref:Uncharacterized protein n=1 Tax=Ilex paraguariensis TaxID=185542 RepID=A0ABC8QVM0_9AQUA